MKRILILLVAILTVLAMTSCDIILDMDILGTFDNINDDEPDDGEDEEQPDDGEDEEQPDDGEDEEQPDDGEDEEQPDDGSDEEQPDDGGDEEQPDDGGDEEQPDDGGDEEQPDDSGNDTEALSGLVLIKNGKANFRFVYSTDAGSSVINKIDTLVKKLRELGVEIENPVMAGDLASISECEILVGTGITNRGDECNVNEKNYGEDGYVIKTVGNRIVIAGGSMTMTATAFDLFSESYLKVTNNTEEIGNINFTESILVEKFTEYVIKGITVAGTDLSEFVIVKDLDGMADYGDSFVADFRDDLYNASGYWLDIITSSDTTDKAHKIIIRYTADAIEGDTDGYGFVARVKGGDLVFECSYANAMTKFFEKTVNDLIFSRKNAISISDQYSKFEEASVVYYSDFGAVGNGVTDDFKAMLAAHQYANECGQTVKGTPGATYYVNKDFTESITVYTNVDLQGATIIINDDSDIAHNNRGNVIYNLTRKNGVGQILSGTALDEMLNGYQEWILRDDTELPFLVPYLKGDSYVIVTNKYHKDFVRYGSNQSTGNVRTDIFLVDKDGKIQPGYEASFEFEFITQVEIYEISEEEIVIENGTIKNICCTVRAATNYKNKYLSYSRGISVNRSNVVIKDMTFRTINEPDIDYSANPYDSFQANYGKRSESYPYSGFIIANKAYNLLVEDCTMSARTTYYEDMPATSSLGGRIPNPTAMGSYGYTYSYSSNVRHINVDQYSETGIADDRYWGIMNSNTCKNFYFEDCEVNGFNANLGFWNGSIINSTIGSHIKIIGGGTFILDRVTRVGNSANFIDMRPDYGSSFDGDIIIKDCVFEAKYGYNSMRGQSYNKNSRETAYMFSTSVWANPTEEYLTWDFGYTCSLPENIIIDNFKCYAGEYYIFQDIPDVSFNTYQITKSITIKNMELIDVCKSRECTKLKAIPVTYIPKEL